MTAPHLPVVVVGGGQAGLSMSRILSERGIRHLVLEANRPGHAWGAERWDTFCLVTPNWQCRLPGFPYDGDDPDGFMGRDEIVAYLDRYVRSFDPPLRCGVTVRRLDRLPEGGFRLDTTDGIVTADQVVVATGGYHDPIVPSWADGLDPGLLQLHSSQYRTPEALPDGAVLVVGSGQSGAQIAEDLHLAGREVHLCLGDAPRVARRYRGRDVVAWLDLMGFYDLPVERHPLRERVRDNTNHYVTGRDGGRDIDLRLRAAEGMKLYGRFEHGAGTRFRFGGGVREKLDAADKVSEDIKRSIDRYIAEHDVAAPEEAPYRPVWVPGPDTLSLDAAEARIRAVVWCIGFTMNFRWIGPDVLDGRGAPIHQRGVTAEPGLYLLGLPWLHSWGSGRFSGVARDAAFLADRIAAAPVAEPVGAG